jgi:hypothetical protein
MATTARLLAEHLNLSVCAYADMDEDEDGFTIRGDWAAPGRPASSALPPRRLRKLAVENLSAGLPLVVNDNLQESRPKRRRRSRTSGSPPPSACRWSRKAG